MEDGSTSLRCLSAQSLGPVNGMAYGYRTARRLFRAKSLAPAGTVKMGRTARELRFGIGWDSTNIAANTAQGSVKWADGAGAGFSDQSHLCQICHALFQHPWPSAGNDGIIASPSFLGLSHLGVAPSGSCQLAHCPLSSHPMLAKLMGFLLLGSCAFLTGSQARWYIARPRREQRIYFANHQSHADW